jgi:alpha-1,3-rhamnosyl/mannosyltransferase
MPLVFVGRYGWMMEDFHRELAALDISAKVLFTGYVDDAELAWLYRNCRANIYTSHFEGFGLPVLEGMEFGAPTIASDCTALREIAGDAAILVKPGDTEELARAMLHVARSADERARLARRAAAQAALFDPKQSAASLLTVYGEAVDLGSRHASA